MQTVLMQLNLAIKNFSTCKVGGCIVWTSFVVLANLCQVFNVMHLRIKVLNKVRQAPNQADSTSQTALHHTYQQGVT